jgi:hypothetical protein
MWVDMLHSAAWAFGLSLTTTVLSVVMYFVRVHRDDLSADRESVPYLDLNCGGTNTCECIIAAASASIRAGGEKASGAYHALSTADTHVAALVLQFTYGAEIQLSDDAQHTRDPRKMIRVTLELCREGLRRALRAIDEDLAANENHHLCHIYLMVTCTMQRSLSNGTQAAYRCCVRHHI